MAESAERRERLVETYREASVCPRCPLSETRTKVVFGAGNADADLMFVGEAPGAEEDRTGLPFVGRAGKFLGELLEGIEMTRHDVFIANVLKCLRYNTPVQLGDGSWERIGRLVGARYSGQVMSVDEHGHIVPRRVIGWHASPVGNRRVYKLSFASAKVAGRRGRVSTQLTGDHPVLTERGYVRADALVEGDKVAVGQGLSRLAKDVVCGTVLGDGHLNASSAHLFFSHCEAQEGYARFKAELIAELRPRITRARLKAVVGGPPARDAIHVRTLAHRAVGLLRSEFYGSKRRVPTWIEHELNERMLAFWFMDDGYMRIREGGRQPLAEIASVAFTDADRQVLLRGLMRLGLPAKVSRGRFYFDVPTSKLLSERIAPFVPHAMRYKLHPEVRDRVGLDPNRLVAGPVEVLYDDVLIEDVTDHPRADKTFFCIDVEGTHSFVTPGGVVHNCRPPGNRDPQPLEIEACRPWLDDQVGLIQPRVIATLGNFATKLLTANQTGITKVRGTAQGHVLGGRPVWVFPLFHPAAGLRTPRVAEQLREDFRSIPPLIERPLPEPPPGIAAQPAEADLQPEAAPPSDDQLDIFG